MPLSSEDLQQIAARTLAHYEQHAQSYWEGTRDHDVSQNIAALLKHVPGPPPFDLLDFGCGPGRDLHTFKALGHHAVGLEGAPMCPPRCCDNCRPACGCSAPTRAAMARRAGTVSATAHFTTGQPGAPW